MSWRRIFRPRAAASWFGRKMPPEPHGRSAGARSVRSAPQRRTGEPAGRGLTVTGFPSVTLGDPATAMKVRGYPMTAGGGQDPVRRVATSTRRRIPGVGFPRPGVWRRGEVLGVLTPGTCRRRGFRRSSPARSADGGRALCDEDAAAIHHQLGLARRGVHDRDGQIDSALRGAVRYGRRQTVLVSAISSGCFGRSPGDRSAAPLRFRFNLARRVIAAKVRLSTAPMRRKTGLRGRRPHGGSPEVLMRFVSTVALLRLMR